MLRRLRGRAGAHATGDGDLALEDGSRVGVIGGGPAGSFFSYFLLAMADSIGLDLKVDIYEPRFFTHRGPAGCNHCGGIVSESLVQMLAAEGINLPPTVVQQGIDSYVLHTDVGDVRIQSPRDEKRIAAVYRGNGPRESEPVEVAGFDRHLLELSASHGARVVRKMADAVTWVNGRPRIASSDGTTSEYDLLVVAAGVNSQALHLFSDASHQFGEPATQRTFICEFRLGAEKIREWFGTSMHVFLLPVPRLGFAAIIPKGEFITLCLLGDDLDRTFLDDEQFVTGLTLADHDLAILVDPTECAHGRHGHGRSSTWTRPRTRADGSERANSAISPGWSIRHKISLYGALPLKMSHRTPESRWAPCPGACSRAVTETSSRRSGLIRFATRVKKNASRPTALSSRMVWHSGR